MKMIIKSKSNNNPESNQKLHRLLQKMKDPVMLQKIWTILGENPKNKSGTKSTADPHRQKNPTINKNKGTPPYPSLEKGSSFLETYLFVLSSVYLTLEVNRDFYCKALSVVSHNYLHLIKHHGVTQGTSKWKDRVQYTVLLVERRNPDPLSFVSTEKGFPVLTIFKELTPLLMVIYNRGENWVKAYQALQTILSLPRLSEEIPDFDIVSIVTPFPREKGQNFNKQLQSFKTFVSNHKSFRLNEDFDKNSLLCLPRMRMTSGPNGKVTLESSHSEAILLHLNRTLAAAYKHLCTITGNTDLYSYTLSLSKTKLLESELKQGFKNLGKITQVPDSLNKNRVVAMVDYWTNILLAPIEEVIRGLLNTNFHHTDFLRNHNEGVLKIKKLGLKSWSIDLKNWTDRFPIKLQEIILDNLLGNNAGQHWRILMTKRDYAVGKSDKTIRYGVGQPMGSKASFAVASLTHHAFIHFCWSLLPKEYTSNKDLRNLYAIVGDDLVIADELLQAEVRKQYKISDVEVSEAKTKIPVGEDCFTEFCSRIIINGCDASRFPPSLIRGASQNWRDLPLLLLEMKKREIEINFSLLSVLPLLQRVDRSGVSYLSHLKTIMKYPLMGQSLEEFSDKIEAPIRVPKFADKKGVEDSLYIWQVLAASETVMKSVDLLEKKFLSDDNDFQQTEQAVVTVHFMKETTYSQELFSSEGRLYKVAQSDYLKVKNWENPVPHPAALACAYTVALSYVWALKGIPDHNIETQESPFDRVIYQLRTLGRFISSIDPKASDVMIITSANHGRDFVRNQMFIISNILRLLDTSQDGLIEVGKDAKIKLDLSKPSSLIPYLITDRVVDWDSVPRLFRMVMKREDTIDFGEVPKLDSDPTGFTVELVGDPFMDSKNPDGFTCWD
jgi:hypothetical protein